MVDYLSSPSSSENESKMVHNAKSACDPHREWIEKQVGLGRNGVSIYQDLVERYGFTHKYNSVKRFVRGIKKKDPKQFDRLEFPPGEEAQVDYGSTPFFHVYDPIGAPSEFAHTHVV